MTSYQVENNEWSMNGQVILNRCQQWNCPVRFGGIKNVKNTDFDPKIKSIEFL